MPVLNLKAVSPLVGSDTFVWLASSLAMAGRTGGYYHRRERIEPSPQVGDEQKRLRDVEGERRPHRPAGRPRKTVGRARRTFLGTDDALNRPMAPSLKGR